jgi:carbon storage regulator
MLVLSRKKNEAIVIGDNVRIKVLKVSGNTVRIGIQAPREVEVVRGELAPYGISDEDTSEGDSASGPKLEAVQEDGEGYSYELTLPLESEEPATLPNPFVAQAM